jgi:hypothetical protein
MTVALRPHHQEKMLQTLEIGAEHADLGCSAKPGF